MPWIPAFAGMTGTLGRYGGINEDFVLVERWGEGEADGSQEMVEGVGKTLVKAVKRRALGVGEGLVGGNRVEESSGQRSIDAVEEFEEDQADRISFGRQAVAAATGQLFDKAFRAEFGEVVSKGGQAVLFGSATESGNDMRVDFACAEGVGGRDLGKSYERVH